MSNFQGNPQFVLVHKESNTLGTAAFVLALLGFFSVGIFAPIALIMSIVALQKQPKDLAVAGLIISLFTIPLGLVLWMFVLIPMMIAGGMLATAAASAPIVAAVPSAQAQASAQPLPPGAVASVSDPKMIRSPTNGYTLRMTITNTSSEPLTKVGVDVSLVDFNGEVLAKDSLVTSMRPLAPGASRLVEIDTPRYSPLAAEVPSTVKARVVVRKTGSEQYDEPADRR